MTGRTELAGLPVGGPATLPAVKAHLGITDTKDDDTLTSKVAAVNSLVRAWPVSEAAVDAATWPEFIVQGAVMLAARWFRRKGSPTGVEVSGPDGAVYVSRNDPDVAQLLQLGSYDGPSV